MPAELKLDPDKVKWRIADGEVIAMDLVSSRYFAVNATGAALWPALADGATRAGLEAALAERFGIDAPTAARDVGVLVDALRTRGLLL